MSCEKRNVFLWPIDFARFTRGSEEWKKAGSPLAGGFYGCLLQLVGDLDYYSSYLQVPRWSLRSGPCSQRRCTFSGPLSWLDNKRNSPWQGASLTTGDWRSHFNPTCHLFRLPGVSALSVTQDYMHCMFLGWLQYLYGSCIHLLVYECFPGGTALQSLFEIGEWIKNYQQRNNTIHKWRRKWDKLSVFTTKGFPKLKGKAADIYGLAGAMWHLWQDKMNPANVQHRQIQLLLKYNYQIDQILQEFHPRYGFLAIPLQEAQSLFELGLTMAQIHAQLMNYYEGVDSKLFNMTAKSHFVLHSLYYARWVHPCLVWCFRGEDTMRRMATLWKSCLTGCKHYQVSKRAAWKERHLLHLRNKLG